MPAASRRIVVQCHERVAIPRRERRHPVRLRVLLVVEEDREVVLGHAAEPHLAGRQTCVDGHAVILRARPASDKVQSRWWTRDRSIKRANLVRTSGERPLVTQAYHRPRG